MGVFTEEERLRRCGCRPGGPTCRVCQLAAGDWPAPAAATPERPKPAGYRPCAYEGEALETVGCNCPGKFVRACRHPENPAGRCTRGPVKDSPHPDCYRCPLKVLGD